jgi:amino acid adenylation domain-containing protein
MSSMTSAHREPAAAGSQKFDNLVELLRLRARQHPARLAYTFLRDGEAEESRLTYGELERRARAVAARLAAYGLKGERVLLLYPAGLEYITAFWGCLYAGAVAVPAYPPRLGRGLERVHAVAADAQAAAALTTSSVLARVKPLLGEVPELAPLRWVAAEEIEDAEADGWEEPRVSGADLAFLQYTSGSTAAPKGVTVTHDNLLRNEAMIARAFGQSEESVIVGWLPLYHDMGLIGNVLQPLYVGARCVLMSPVSFLQSPARWLRAISRYRATTSGGPNFAYDLCAKKVGAEEIASLDLSSWAVAFNGAEAVRAETLERFAEAFGPCGFRREAFYPCYGLAESTLLVTGGSACAGPFVTEVRRDELERGRAVESVDDEDGRALVGCGRAMEGHEVAVVNPESNAPCAEGVVGEIWVAGPSVAAGYWGRPRETEETFGARLAGGKGPYLRTGDLGFVRGGELFVTGRLKDLIIVRGRNLYPHDIERTVEQSHAALRPGCGVAFSFEGDAGESLAVVQEVERRADANLEEVIERVRRAIIEEYEVQPAAVLLVKPGQTPKTSSGKLRRGAAREMFLASRFEPLAEWRAGVAAGALQPAESFKGFGVEDVAQFLRAHAASKLGLEASDLDVRRPLTAYGVDSLAAVEMAHAVETALGVSLPAAELLRGASLLELAAELSRQVEGGAGRSGEEARPAVEVEADADTYPLSHGQRALWFLQRMSPDSAAYNVASAARVKGALDAGAMRRTFDALARRHAALRTTFDASEGEPVQRVRDGARVGFEELHATSWSEAVLGGWLSEQARRPFDLTKGPLLRVSLLTRPEGESMLLLVAHHIITDFWSLAVLLRELGLFYAAETSGSAPRIEPLALTYAEHVRRQAETLAGPRGDRLREFWERKLSKGVPALNLPTDRPRPAAQTFRGASHASRLSARLTLGLKEFARDADATLYHVMLAAFQVLLGRYSGQEEFATGSPAAGRGSAREAGVAGYFVNPLVVRADLSGDPTFEEYVGRVRREALDAFEHQDYPFPLLVERLQPARDASRSPLFQVMFAFQQAHLLRDEGLAPFALGEAGARLELGALTLESLALERRAALFDIRLSAAEFKGEILTSFEYNTDLFDQETIERMARHFETLLEGVVRDPRARVHELPLMGDDELRRLLVEWNDTAAEYDAPRLLHKLFEQQAARTPEATALVFAEERLTYTQLDERAGRLARYLRDGGVGPDVRVAVLMERSIELVVALLGVLKAGGAYVPLDPEYPRERLQFMLEDSGARVLLTQERLRDALPARAASVVCLDTSELTKLPPPSDEARRSASTEVGEENLAYVIYTSGSTGRPKGVMNTHRGIVNRLLWMQDAFGLDSSDVVLQKTPASFDVSVWEFFWPLLTGARLVIAEPGGHRDPAYLAALIERERVTTLHFVPSMLQTFLAQADPARCASLRRVVCSGEALPHELQARFHERLGAELHNFYGPTEAAVDVTHWPCERGDARRVVPIGRPVSNTTLYVLDARMNPAPVGVHGELYIGGVQLARGYSGRPALTAERFVPDTFSHEPGARLYRTGDLARRMPSGEIEFLGRLDFQVKVRGFRIELGEVEAALASHPGVRECVVVAHEVAPGDTRLAAYVVARGEQVAREDLRRHLKERLPDYMTPSSFTLLDAMPLTESGKVDRKALPAAARSTPSAQEFVAPRDQVEEQIAAVWGAVLGLERVGVNDNFFDLGGHSLLATQVVARLNDAFGIELPLRRMFDAPTVAGLAEQVAAALRTSAAHASPPISPAPRDEKLPLSFAQQRLWFLEQLEPGSAAYNMPAALRLSGPLDASALERAVGEIIRRHESLRTTFPCVDASPLQQVAPPGPWRMQVVDLGDVAESEREAEAARLASQEAHRPFDLARGPLLRASLLRLGEEEHLLVLTLHHIVSDGWSLGVFARELRELYTAFTKGEPSPLGELPVQYADFAVWQRASLTGELLDKQLGYWKRQLGGRLPVLELPSDRASLPEPGFRVAAEPWLLAHETNARLKSLGRERGASYFMTLLAAFQALLHRYTGLEDVIVGTPVAGRTRAEVEGLIGLFANTLALRTDLSGDPTFAELLARVREVTLGAYTHQDVPFEMLVEELQPERDVSRTPLFQVMLALENAREPEPELPGLLTRRVGLSGAAAKFDLLLFLRETAEGLVGSWEYAAERLDSETVRRMGRHFRALVEDACAHPEKRVSELELMSDAERHHVLRELNETRAEYERGPCLHQLFERQAARTPEATALVCGGARLSYAELNARAERLASRLRGLGVGPEVPVGVMLTRSIELVVALLGVLKAGGAYVPLDPEYPRERLQFMLEDSGAAALVTETRLREALPRRAAHTLCLDEETAGGAGEDSHAHARHPLASNVAYLIYTSGSTGRPKGVAIEHRSAVTFTQWARDIFTDAQLSGVLASTSVCFDLSVFEIFTPLSWGGKVLLASNALELPALEARDEVTLVNTVPSAMAELVRMGGVPQSVTTVNLAGEPLQNVLARRVYALAGVEQLLNLYGPTEDTTYSTWALVERGGERAVTIGRPVANTQVYLLDSRLRPVAFGLAGELYLGGEGLARGYHGRPALTAERFVPDPFSHEPGARMYRTGDLARYLADGRIEYLGRIDHQVKVRGFRIELGEIESALASHPGVRDVTVIARDDASGNKQLVAYFVAAQAQATTPAELRAHLRERLPVYMVPSLFVRLEAMPLTPNGKTDRKALPAPEEPDGASVEACESPRTETEAAMAELWRALLGRKQVGVHDNFFDLGGHSLLATQLVSRVRESFQVELPLRSVFEAATVAGLAGRVDKARGSTGDEAQPDRGATDAEARETSLAAGPPPVAPTERGATTPLSSAQQRLWFLEQLMPGNPAYNIQAAVMLSGRLDAGALRRTLEEVVRRHEVLRATFHTSSAGPLQSFDADARHEFVTGELRVEGAEAREEFVRRLASEESRRPFDLTKGPLLRCRLLRLDEDEHVLLLTMHHIVSDGWSLGVLLREVAALYEAFTKGEPSPLGELPIQYADFAVWQRASLSGEALRPQLAYWRRQLAGGLTPLALPADKPRPPAQTFRGARRFFALSPELTGALKALGRAHNATLYMTLLAAFKTLLHRYTGQADVVVGTDIANRTRVETEGLIGLFTNQLVLRTDFSGNPTFAEVLRRVREVTLGAYAHQDVPFERLVEELQPERQLNLNPLFQVMFVFQNAPAYELPGLGMRTLDVDEGTTAFDLSLTMEESEDGLKGSVRFSTDLFEEATIARMVAHFENILRAAAADAGAPVRALEMRSESERQQGERAKAGRMESKLKRLMSVKPRAVTISDERLYRASQMREGQRLPLVIRPAAEGVDFPEWAARHRETIEAELHKHGAILFRDFEVASVATFERFARAVSRDLLEYGERSSPRTRLGAGVYTSTDHPADQHILLHNEQSYTLSWPMKIWFFCVQPARAGGRTPIADSREIRRRLPPRIVERFEREGVMYVRNYGDGLGLPWREVFQTEEPAEVESYCRENLIEFEWKGDGRLRTRQVRPAVRRHPKTGEEVWFNHAIFFHVRSLAEAERAALAALGEDELPFNTLYGEGSPIEPETVEAIRAAYDASTVAFDWRAGDVLMLDNMLTAHGREPFEGPRKIVVSMAEPFGG